jgi:peptide/nickel transport system permease protein
MAALLVFLGWLGYRLSHRIYWRNAFREVFERRVVRVCFGILCLYTLVAVLDSVGFHQALRDDRGELVRSAGTGEVQYDRDGLSVLDWMLRGLKDSREKTYSAPFAHRQFTKEQMVDGEGRSVRDYPPLRHPGRHVLGTDRVGNDVLYMGLKGVRTGMIIGAFTTLLVIPFALLFGIVAGYFGGWVDDVIQYIYTVLSSIPSVMLIVAFMIIAGQGLPQLCIIMGITSWTGLCRVLRGEVMKLREMEFVQAGEAMGVSRVRIMVRHLVPNVMHLVLITAVLSFSGRVLAEAVLSYIGIGVGADTYSWGMMINDARLELARSPVIWWKLAAAFFFMVGLVLPANLFGDALRDALDPRLKTQ